LKYFLLYPSASFQFVVKRIPDKIKTTSKVFIRYMKDLHAFFVLLQLEEKNNLHHHYKDEE